MYKQAPKSPAMKALVGNQKNLPAGLKAQIEASPGKMMDSPAKQVTKNKNLGGQPIAGMDSAADVPTSTSFGGRDYDKGYQDGSGVHYYNKGYSSKHGKKGTVKRAGDDGIYHVSRKVEEPISELKNKKANIISPAKQTKKKLTPKQKLALRKTLGEISKENFEKQAPGTKKPVTPKPEPKKPSSSSRLEYLKKVKYNRNGKL